MTTSNKKKKAEQYIQSLPDFKVTELKTLAKILDAPLRRRVKGGMWKAFCKAEIVKSIRSVIGRGTFPDRLARFAEKAGQFSDNKQ